MNPDNYPRALSPRQKRLRAPARRWVEERQEEKERARRQYWSARGRVAVRPKPKSLDEIVERYAS